MGRSSPSSGQNSFLSCCCPVLREFKLWLASNTLLLIFPGDVPLWVCLCDYIRPRVRIRQQSVKGGDNGECSIDLTGVKENPSLHWIKELQLYNSHLYDLHFGRVLSDAHMNAAQTLLRKQFPEIAGLQAICLARYLQFEAVSSQTEGIQIHHTGGFHWVTTSTMAYKGKVKLYDSKHSHGILPVSLTEQIAAIYRAPRDESFIRVQQNACPSATCMEGQTVVSLLLHLLLTLPTATVQSHWFTTRGWWEHTWLSVSPMGKSLHFQGKLNGLRWLNPLWLFSANAECQSSMTRTWSNAQNVRSGSTMRACMGLKPGQHFAENWACRRCSKQKKLIVGKPKKYTPPPTRKQKREE